ncbi:MAG: methionine--tRNA ligase [Alphaproteobacteria bacterium]|nr:methionine--tRNA ligase [Alphaproteobacteria bacterium]
MTKSFYITTPIYYVNDSPHIGHAYTTLACDVMARFKRLDGYDVKFLTGTDEHGQKVDKAAQAAGVTPQAFTDKVSQRFRDLTGVMNFSNDDFIRTTEPRHIKATQALWERIKANGHIYLGSYAGWYSVRDEAFYTETELTKDSDGQRIAPTGAPVEWVEEPSYFFNLSEWQDKLLEFYDAHPDFVVPESRYNEVRSFVKGGLKDLSVSRTSFSWGVPVPGDEKHVMYVWLDALTNYITALGFPETGGEYAQYWDGREGCSPLHVVGKDILRFHAVYWPAFLMAANLKPPARVTAHGWWTNEGQKISKSVGNVIDPIALVNEFGLDPVRYYMMREVPFGNDGNYARASMINRINSDLANNVGNLSQRTLSMIQKNCDAKVPEHGAFTPEDNALLDGAYALLSKLRAHVEKQEFHFVLDSIFALSTQANLYIDQQAPWGLKKTDPARMHTVLYVLAETIRVIALYLQPFIPASAGKMLDQLAIPEDQRRFTFASAKHSLIPGTPLPVPEGIFPRFVEEAEKVA